jgi:hypothetical protein
VVVGIGVLAILAYVYNQPGVQASAPPAPDYTTPGTRPSEDAGILGGIAAQRQAMAALSRQIKTLQGKLASLEARAPVPPADPKVTAMLEQQLKTLQAQIAQARKRPTAAGPDKTPPPVSLRVITRRPGGAKGQPTQPRAPRIEVATRHDIPTDDAAGLAPYLPPQSMARGRVLDGYTGLASLETFPVTLEVTSAFSAPNGKTVPLTGCRFGATATPEELTARGRLTLTRITCVSDTGQTIERPVSGYVTASDNMNGQIAQVFWHERDVLAAFGKGAVPAALVSLFKETRQMVEVATLSGVVVSSGHTVAQEVARRMADIYLDKAEKLASPIIWVGPDTPVYIYVTEGARLDGLHAASPEAEPLATRMMQ